MIGAYAGARHYAAGVVYAGTIPTPSGGDDTTAINNYLTSISNKGGGNVHAVGGNTWSFGAARSGSTPVQINIPANVTLRGDGTNSVFNSTDPNNMAIFLNGNNSGLAYVMVTSTYGGSQGQAIGFDGGSGSSAPRQSTTYGHAVYVSPGVNGFTISNVTTVGGRSGGIFVDGATNGLIDTCTVTYAWADGIGLYSGASSITVQNCTVNGCGDDGISVVPYANPASTGIVVQNNLVENGYYGRGITDVGGNGVLFQGNTVNTYYASGLMCDTDPQTGPGEPSPTNGTWNNNTVINTPNPSSLYAGAYFVFRNVTNYHITNNKAQSLPSGTQPIAVDNTSTGQYSYSGNSPASSNPPW